MFNITTWIFLFGVWYFFLKLFHHSFADIFGVIVVVLIMIKVLMMVIKLLERN